MAKNQRKPPAQVTDTLFRLAAEAKAAGDEAAAFWWGKFIAEALAATKPKRKRRRGVKARLAATGEAIVLDAERVKELE